MCSLKISQRLSVWEKDKTTPSVIHWWYTRNHIRCPLWTLWHSKWVGSGQQVFSSSVSYNMTHLWADRYGKGLIQMAWGLHGPGLQLIHSRERDCGKKSKRNKSMSENLTGSKAGSKMSPVQSRSCWLTSSAMITGRMGGVGVGGRGLLAGATQSVGTYSLCFSALVFVTAVKAESHKHPP